MHLRADRLIPPIMHFVNCAGPGLTRRRAGKGWTYFDPKGRRIRQADLIQRLNKLAIPPAYTDVWICADPEGHLQAVGRDVRGRRQYLYHPEWRRKRDRAKYDRTLEFGQALPRIRKKVAADLKRHELDRDRVTAAVVRLIDVTHIRVGNKVYAKTNHSYGATTLQDQHVMLNSTSMQLRFVAKGGKKIQRKVSDAQLVRLLRRCHELPGRTLFCYLDADGETRTITSSDVNAYLKTASGDDFSAKHFRTWSGSVKAFEVIAELLAQGRDPATIKLKEVLKPVSESLGNTPAICKASYIHPKVLTQITHENPKPSDFLDWPRPTKYLSAAERAFLRFLNPARGAPARYRGASSNRPTPPA